MAFVRVSRLRGVVETCYFFWADLKVVEGDSNAAVAREGAVMDRDLLSLLFSEAHVRELASLQTMLQSILYAKACGWREALGLAPVVLAHLYAPSCTYSARVPFPPYTALDLAF